MKPEVTVVVLNYNGLDLTRNCLESLKKTAYSNFKIVVVDNASENSEGQKLQEEYGDAAEIVCNQSNLGFAEGCNVVLRRLATKYAVLLNNDTEVSPDWLAPLVEFMERQPDAGACQPKILSLRDKKCFEYSGACGGFMDVFGYPFTRGRIFYTIEEDRGQYDSTVEINWACGTAICLRKEALDQVGLFDPIFFMYAEEGDLCWRLYNCGWKIFSVPSSVIYHYGMASSHKNLRFKMSLTHRNGLILLIKNHTLPALSYVLPVRILLDFVTFFAYIVRGEFIFSVSLITAYGSLIRNIFNVIDSRGQAQNLYRKFKHRALPYLLYQRPIVLDYVLGKKRFSDVSRTWFGKEAPSDNKP